MALSDRIESFILELLKEDNDWLELGRNELASVFNCVPSQINYVIATRFSPERGYVVESRRGGGGCVRIKRIPVGENNPIYQTAARIGNEIDYDTAKAVLDYLTSINAIDEENRNLILAAVSPKTLSKAEIFKDTIRADILRNTLISMI